MRSGSNFSQVERPHSFLWTVSSAFVDLTEIQGSFICNGTFDSTATVLTSFVFFGGRVSNPRDFPGKRSDSTFLSCIRIRILCESPCPPLAWRDWCPCARAQRSTLGPRTDSSIRVQPQPRNFVAILMSFIIWSRRAGGCRDPEREPAERRWAEAPHAYGRGRSDLRGRREENAPNSMLFGSEGDSGLHRKQVRTKLKPLGLL